MIDKIIIWIKQKCFKSAFLLYSYLYQILYFVLDLLPHFIRDIVFKLTFKKIGTNVIIDYGCYFRYVRNIVIGNNTSINKNCEFYTSANLGATIKIGDSSAISPNVKFYAIAHDPNQLSLPEVAKDIIVENNCWIYLEMKQNVEKK